MEVYEMSRQITDENIDRYGEYLFQEEKAASTVKKYVREVEIFAKWLSGREATKELAAQWKEELQMCGYVPRTVNAMLSAVNGFFSFMGWQDCRVKFLKIQRQMFRDASKDLDIEEYERLVNAAYRLNNRRLGLVIETICGTGIRVSELEYITVDAVRAGKAEIVLKGKVRVILMPGQLIRKLLEYAGEQNISSGGIFMTRNGKNLSRRQIWAEMKKLCADAGVESSKVFPHNLRHLFARTFYQAHGDIVRLADVLGHSSIDTTRIYLLSTGAEHVRQLDCLGLVS